MARSTPIVEITRWIMIQLRTIIPSTNDLIINFRYFQKIPLPSILIAILKSDYGSFLCVLNLGKIFLQI